MPKTTPTKPAATKRKAPTPPTTTITTDQWTKGLSKSERTAKLAEIRAWARDHGHADIPSYGRIPQTALADYAAAHPATDTIAPQVDIQEPEQDTNEPTSDIAHRSDMLDETRARLVELNAEADGEPDLLTERIENYQGGLIAEARASVALDKGDGETHTVDEAMASRPEWADVAIAADVEKARSLAVRLEQKLARSEETRAHEAELHSTAIANLHEELSKAYDARGDARERFDTLTRDYNDLRQERDREIERRTQTDLHLDVVRSERDDLRAQLAAEPAVYAPDLQHDLELRVLHAVTVADRDRLAEQLHDQQAAYRLLNVLYTSEVTDHARLKQRIEDAAIANRRWWHRRARA